MHVLLLLLQWLFQMYSEIFEVEVDACLKQSTWIGQSGPSLMAVPS